MYKNACSLSCLPLGGVCTVTAVKADGIQRRRMLDLGLVPGTRVEALHKSPFGNPIAYLIRGSVIALRLEDAQKIRVRLSL